MSHPSVLAVFSLLSVSALAQDGWADIQHKVTPVAGKVFLIEAAGGNIAAQVGDDGILLVDDQFRPLIPKLKEALKTVAPDKRIRFVLNTHHHGDHTDGNGILGPDGATIVAHDNVRARMKARMEDPSPNANSGRPPLPVSALPVLTFRDGVSVHFNGEEIRALHLPAGHTDGDSMILFTQSKVLHLGDQLFTSQLPFVDLDNGGSVAGLISSLERVVKEVPADVKIIPGHGPLSTMDDVKKMIAMLKETRGIVEKAVKRGKTLEQLKKDRPLAKWDRWATDFVPMDRWLETLHREVSGKSASVPANPGR